MKRFSADPRCSLVGETALSQKPLCTLPLIGLHRIVFHAHPVAAREALKVCFHCWASIVWISFCVHAMDCSLLLAWCPLTVSGCTVAH